MKRLKRRQFWCSVALFPLLLAIASPDAKATSVPAPAEPINPRVRWETPTPPGTLTEVSQAQAQRYAQTVAIYAGRNSAITFRTGERIQFLQVSDPSAIVFNTNTPVESGQATVILLRLIRPLRFPGLLTTERPNLTVTTTRGTYFFDLQPVHQEQSRNQPSGVAIVPGNSLSFAAFGQTTIVTSRGRATAEDIRRGLSVAIGRNYTRPDDPVVTQVQRAMTLMRQGASIPEIVATTSAPTLPQVLARLGELGIESGQVNPSQFPNVSPDALSNSSSAS
ncbi:hypothetical protein NDI45_22855 [Leptolyngbya sp. GB1-A1]|uniref:hypothetical protein n=1 Tax=Leptolyngbya sp. GB1-A1 TaxID=2933908 RepID=UPI00329A7425